MDEIEYKLQKKNAILVVNVSTPIMSFNLAVNNFKFQKTIINFLYPNTDSVLCVQ